MCGGATVKRPAFGHCMRCPYGSKNEVPTSCKTAGLSDGVEEPPGGGWDKQECLFNGRVFSRTLTRAAPERSVSVRRSRDLPRRNELHPSATRGPNDYPAATLCASGQESVCLRDQFDPVFGQKRAPGGVKRWPRSGLAGDFRHLAVVWQASGATMGSFCLMVKSSEL